MRWGGIFDVDGLKRRLDHLDSMTSQEGFWDDNARAQEVVQERAGIEAIVGRHGKLSNEVTELGELLELASMEDDEEMVAEVADQVPRLEAGVREAELDRMLDRPEDKSDAILYVNPGAGGVDAQDWAEILFRMYLRWCERKGFKVEVLNQQPGDEAGIKEAHVHVSAALNAYGYLQARRTASIAWSASAPSTATRAVTPRSRAVHVSCRTWTTTSTLDSIEIKDEDIEMSTRCARAAPGGQHVNKHRVRRAPEARADAASS